MMQGEGEADRDQPAQPALIDARTSAFLCTLAEHAARVEAALKALESIEGSIENYRVKAREGTLDSTTMTDVRVELQSSLDHYLK